MVTDRKLVITSRAFAYHRDGTFTAEASTLDAYCREAGFTGRGAPCLEKRGDEWGFWMKSHRTGAEVWFKYLTDEKDLSGEVLNTLFYSSLHNIFVKVFND